MKNLPTLVGNWEGKPTETTRSIDEKPPNPVGKLRRKTERSMALAIVGRAIQAAA